MILNCCVLLLTVCLWAQQSSVNKTEKVAIQRAKNLIVSSFDRSLPNVSLEFFLKYEGGGAPIKWQVNDCGDQTASLALDQEHGSPMCVEADFEFKGQTAVTILVSVGTFKIAPSAVPALISVTITESGTSRSVRHLNDLPVELHRPAPRLPRDLPVPLGALSSDPKSPEDRPRFALGVFSIPRVRTSGQDGVVQPFTAEVGDVLYERHDQRMWVRLARRKLRLE